MGYKILNISMPERENDWGTLQISVFKNTYFRFEMKNGEAVLDESLFADQVESPGGKFQYLSPDSRLYREVQEVLSREVDEKG